MQVKKELCGLYKPSFIELERFQLLDTAMSGYDGFHKMFAHYKHGSLGPVYMIPLTRDSMKR